MQRDLQQPLGVDILMENEGKNKYKVAIAEPHEEPRIIEIDGSLKSMQEIVGGLIEPFDVLFGTTPSLYVNDEGIYKCEPNRVVYATQEMVDQGYLSMMNFKPLKQAGEVYAVLFGTILGVSYDLDEDGEMQIRDITDEEFRAFNNRFNFGLSHVHLASVLGILDGGIVTEVKGEKNEL